MEEVEERLTVLSRLFPVGKNPLTVGSKEIPWRKIPVGETGVTEPVTRCVEGGECRCHLDRKHPRTTARLPGHGLKQEEPLFTEDDPRDRERSGEEAAERKQRLTLALERLTALPLKGYLRDRVRFSALVDHRCDEATRVV
jgi:hypothetical protein